MTDIREFPAAAITRLFVDPEQMKELVAAATIIAPLTEPETIAVIPGVGEASILKYEDGWASVWLPVEIEGAAIIATALARRADAIDAATAYLAAAGHD